MKTGLTEKEILYRYGLKWSEEKKGKEFHNFVDWELVENAYEQEQEEKAMKIILRNLFEEHGFLYVANVERLVNQLELESEIKQIPQSVAEKIRFCYTTSPDWFYPSIDVNQAFESLLMTEEENAAFIQRLCPGYILEKTFQPESAKQRLKENFEHLLRYIGGQVSKTTLAENLRKELIPVFYEQRRIFLEQK